MKDTKYDILIMSFSIEHSFTMLKKWKSEYNKTTVPVVFFVSNISEANELFKLQFETLQRNVQPIDVISNNSNADIAKIVQYATQRTIKNYFWEQVQHKVPCDYCAEFPIKGKRWTVENKKYNLCNNCYLRSLGTAGKKLTRYYNPVLEEPETLQPWPPKNRNIKEILFATKKEEPKKKRRKMGKKF